MIVSDLLRASLRSIGALSTGEGVLTIQEIPDGEYTDLLMALQVMLRAWSTKQINVFSSDRESITLVSGQNSYTWGTGGNISTERPNQLIDVFVRDSQGTDIPVDIIPEAEYNSFVVKSTLGRPYAAFYEPNYPLGVLHIYPTPQDAETLFLESLKPFTETSSFASVTNTLSFPPNYQEPIISNLAIRIAPYYGITVPAETAAIAAKSYSDLISLNAANQVQPARISLPVMGCYGGTGGRYNINEG